MLMSVYNDETQITGRALHFVAKTYHPMFVHSDELHVREEVVLFGGVQSCCFVIHNPFH